MTESTPTLPRLGGYTLLADIAHGGMAEVFLATQEGPQGFQKFVVIKKILPHLAKEPEFVRMFLDEARLAALINHPNVVSIYELGEEPATGAYFMAMEYIDGRNLREVADIARRQRRALSPRMCARLVADACAGLHFAHELTRPDTGEALKIVHRDISPENLLVTYGGLVKVVDFGIAKAAQSENLTKTGQVKGKLSYLSPEQLQGRKVDRRVDVWALGVTLYWLLAGEKPFRGAGDGQIMKAILEDTPAPLPKRGRESLAPYQKVIDRALAKDPAERYPTAAAMQEELEALAARGDSKSDKPMTVATVAAMMEKLFPKATDPERLRHRQILKNQPPEVIEEISLSPVEVAPERKSRVGWLAAALVVAVAGTAFLARKTFLDAQQEEPVAAPPKAAMPTVSEPTPAVAPVVTVPMPPPVIDAGEVAQAVAPPSSPPVAPPAEPPPKPEPVVHRPEPSGYLVVQARPGTLVLVDGIRLGVTPLPSQRVAPGKRRVELIDPNPPTNPPANAPRNSARATHRALEIEFRVGQVSFVR